MKISLEEGNHNGTRTTNSWTCSLVYQENRVIPSASDCRRGFLPDVGVFIRRFGSFPEARRRAGLTEWESMNYLSIKKKQERNLKLKLQTV